jgi:hypothetical protein
MSNKAGHSRTVCTLLGCGVSRNAGSTKDQLAHDLLEFVKT